MRFYTYKIIIIKEYGHREKYIVIEGKKKSTDGKIMLFTDGGDPWK